MLFSIIIPIYNVAQYIPKCLESVFSQSFCDLEVICVDDGSSDNSLTIVNHFVNEVNSRFPDSTSSHLSVIHQENQGLSAARNAGLKVAHGDYILFLDSDDWLEPDALQTLANNLCGEDMLCFNGRRFLEDNQQYEAPDRIDPESSLSGWDYYNRYALKHRNFAFVCVVLRCYRRQFLLDNNLFFKPGIFHEDNLFTPYACYFAQKVKVIPDVLYDYRVRSQSIMTTRSLKHWHDIITTANELASFFDDKPVEKTTLYQSLTHHYQSAFASVGPKEDKQLLPLVNWQLYRQVSRTKPRHRLQYAAMRLSPSIFRQINKML